MDVYSVPSLSATEVMVVEYSPKGYVIQSEISEALVEQMGLTINEPSDGDCEELDPANLISFYL
jgi:hypothetical protein